MARHQILTLRGLRAAPPFWLAECEVAVPPMAGQYLLVDVGQPLREALFPAQVEAERFTCAVPAGHPLTRLLPGSTLRAYGPLGRGFRVGEVTRLLLVAEATHWPLLLPLADAAEEVVFILEANTRAQLPALERLPANVEVVLLTRDGSAGQPGYLEHEASPLRDLVRWAERVCLACALERYAGLATLIRDARLHVTADFAQALVQVPMPCGIGACDVCRISVGEREHVTCIEGPVFDVLELGPWRGLS